MKCNLTMERSLKNGLKSEFLGVLEFLTHLYNVIIKQQPEAVALHDGDVMSTVWATAGKGMENLLSRSLFPPRIHLWLSQLHFPAFRVRFLDFYQIASIKMSFLAT